MTSPPSQEIVLDEQEISRALERMAHGIVARCAGEPLAIVGLLSQGDIIARRLVEIAKAEGADAMVLVDDVLYTGRTIRAALNALFDYGRPARIELACLIDRGGREVPIQPDYTGHVLDHAGAKVVVSMKEADGVDRVVISGK